MQLRPHHLLCTQGYRGSGYSEAFVKHMDQVTARLRSEDATPVELVFSTDTLCSCCPNMLGTDHCTDNEKVKRFDAKVVSYFHLEEKTYIYQDLVKEIRRQMTPEIMDDICSDCGWYSVSACKEAMTQKYTG